MADEEPEMMLVEPTEADLKKAEALEAEAETLREVKEVPVPVKHEHEKHIGLDNGMGDVSYMDAPRGWLRDRTVLIGSVTYEHTSEDADGCWIYRHLG